MQYIKCRAISAVRQIFMTINKSVAFHALVQRHNSITLLKVLNWLKFNPIYSKYMLTNRTITSKLGHIVVHLLGLWLQITFASCCDLAFMQVRIQYSLHSRSAHKHAAMTE